MASDPRALVVYLLGTSKTTLVPDRSPAIIKLEKKPFDQDELSSITDPSHWSKIDVVRAD